MGKEFLVSPTMPHAELWNNLTHNLVTRLKHIGFSVDLKLGDTGQYEATTWETRNDRSTGTTATSVWPTQAIESANINYLNVRQNADGVSTRSST